MEEISILLEDILNRDLIRMVVSGSKKKEGLQKVKVRPVEKRGSLLFQIESFTKTQAFHENLDADGARERILSYMEDFRQLQAETVNETASVLVSKKGKATVKRRRRTQAACPADHSHDRKKRSIIEEGTVVPFLRDLGVMTQDGRIVRTKTDKFRQINRFLEFIEDILPQLDKDRELTVIDFGCGKSYLTFAMYHYLHELKGYDIRIVGLDLKEEVIAHCSALAETYGYDKLTFLKGDIADYDGAERADMVVTLHACDTATDYALAKAVGWDAKVILSVPCCQHELNGQMSGQRNARLNGQQNVQMDGQAETGRGGDSAEYLAPLMDYGLLKERFAALATDGLRAKYLESMGYETQVLEFIDMEHTPKNILLRAVKKGKKDEKALEQIRKCEQFLGVAPTLGRIIKGSDKR